MLKANSLWSICREIFYRNPRIEAEDYYNSDNMAALKLLNSKSTFSLSQGLRNYFYCCFPSSDSNVSPTRSTEGVLKADDLEKTLSEQAEKEKKENEAKRGEGEEEEEEGDEGSLRRRRSLIADNFGYESDAKDQSDARPPLEISLESCKRTGAPEPTERSRIAEHPSGIQGQGEESKTATAVKKGLNSLLAIAERATAEESTAGDVRQESPGQDNQSANC